MCDAATRVTIALATTAAASPMVKLRLNRKRDRFGVTTDATSWLAQIATARCGMSRGTSIEEVSEELADDGAASIASMGGAAGGLGSAANKSVTTRSGGRSSSACIRTSYARARC